MKEKFFRERKSFYEAKMNSNETVNDWFNRISQLIVPCQFGRELNLKLLLDRFVVGLEDDVFDIICDQLDLFNIKTLLNTVDQIKYSLSSELTENVVPHPTRSEEVFLITELPDETISESIFDYAANGTTTKGLMIEKDMKSRTDIDSLEEVISQILKEFRSNNFKSLFTFSFFRLILVKSK